MDIYLACVADELLKFQVQVLLFYTGFFSLLNIPQLKIPVLVYTNLGYSPVLAGEYSVT